MTPAVLAFLRETKVGEFVTLAALGGEREVEEEPADEGEEWGPGLLRRYLSFVFSLVRLLSLGRIWDGGDQGAPL